MPQSKMHIQTVLGPVAPECIGATDCHEHLFIRGGIPVLLYPDFHLTDYPKIYDEAARFAAVGGSAIVEMSPLDWGRDAESLIRLSSETGLHIIAATGFHKISYYTERHWIHSYDESQLVSLVCDELEVGMDQHAYNGPFVSRTSARAGVIKVGTQRGIFSETELKLLRVAARAHLQTGAPIITHTDEGELAIEQVSYLMEQGVDPRRIAISHIDRRIDIVYHNKLASTGALLEYDALTRTKQGFDKSTLQLVLDMVSSGKAGSILLGGDISRQGYWKSYGGEPGLDFVVGGFRSALVTAGLTNDIIDQIYIQNPRSFLAWA